MQSYFWMVWFAVHFCHKACGISRTNCQGQSWKNPWWNLTNASILAQLMFSGTIYSPHPKLAPLVRLGYMAHASVLVSWLWSTNTMKRIILCAHNVGSYAFTSRNRKNKKNVPLKTRPSKNVPPVSCMGTLWNATPVQANLASLTPCCRGPLHFINMIQGEKKNIDFAHAGTWSFWNFSKHQ